VFRLKTGLGLIVVWKETVSCSTF